MRHDDFLACHQRLRTALATEQTKRGPNLDWIEGERLALTVAANEWAADHGLDQLVVADVERVEHRASGHFDYTSKLALYVTELLYYGKVRDDA